MKMEYDKVANLYSKSMNDVRLKCCFELGVWKEQTGKLITTNTQYIWLLSTIGHIVWKRVRKMIQIYHVKYTLEYSARIYSNRKQFEMNKCEMISNDQQLNKLLLNLSNENQ